MQPTMGKALSRFLRAYYRGPDHPMKLRFWWWFRRALNYPRLTIPYANGGWITVDERDLIQGELFASGGYESEVWEILSGSVVSEEIVWDVGAHIGSFSIRALLDPHVREIHAFEPDPVTCTILETNLRLNDGRYTVHRIALDEQRRIRPLHRGPIANMGLSSLEFSWTEERVPVECVRADELVKSGQAPQPTLMKVDVEGSEWAVLSGAREVLKNPAMKAMVFEAPCDEKGTITDSSLLEFLKELDFAVEHIRRPKGHIEGRENYLAVKKRL